MEIVRRLFLLLISKDFYVFQWSNSPWKCVSNDIYFCQNPNQITMQLMVIFFKCSERRGQDNLFCLTFFKNSNFYSGSYSLIGHLSCLTICLTSFYIFYFCTLNFRARLINSLSMGVQFFNFRACLFAKYYVYAMSLFLRTEETMVVFSANAFVRITSNLFFPWF